ncbi:MAG: hypothetical protein ACK6CU_21545 [Deltaproteobacteria bacterium]
MDDLWVALWLVAFAVITALAGYLLYANRKKRLVEARGAHGDASSPPRPHGHHRPGH